MNRDRGFHTTQWSVVSLARAEDAEARHQALEQLLATYYPALSTHLVARMGIERGRAEDLLQSFVVQKILERDLFARADNNRGRLRSLLLKSLENFARTYLAQQRAADLPPDAVRARADAAASCPVSAFDVAWARRVLVQALCSMSDECRQHGRQHIWDVFEARVVGPLLGRPSVSYAQLVKQLGYRTPQEACNALLGAKRMFRRTLRTVVAESLDCEDEIDDELAQLYTILSQAAAGHDLLHASDREPADAPPYAAVLSGIDRGDPQALALLMRMPIDQETLWDETDLAGLLEHQLAVPLNFVFPKLASGAARASAGMPTFRTLMSERRPSLRILTEVKDAAKRATGDGSILTPRPLAVTLYFAAIALALVRRGERITRSDDEVLSYGFGQVLHQEWLDKSLTQLFDEALGQVRTASEGRE